MLGGGGGGEGKRKGSGVGASYKKQWKLFGYYIPFCLSLFGIEDYNLEINSK